MVTFKLSHTLSKVDMVKLRDPERILRIFGLSLNINNAISLWLKPLDLRNSLIRLPNFSRKISVSVFNGAIQLKIKIL